MPLALVALFSLALTGLLLLVLNGRRRRQAEAGDEFAWPHFAAELEAMGLHDPYVPLRTDALRIECRGTGALGLDLVVTTLARDADGRAYFDGTGQHAAEETHRFRLTGISLGR